MNRIGYGWSLETIAGKGSTMDLARNGCAGVDKQYPGRSIDLA